MASIEAQRTTDPRMDAHAMMTGCEFSQDDFFQSAIEGDHKKVAYFLGHGADPKANHSHALVLAAHSGNAACVELLIPLSNPKARGSIALGWAATKGNVDCVKLLIPVSDPKARDSYALQWAAERGRASCVELLIPVSDPKAKESHALRRAANHGHADCVRLLLPVSAPLLSNKKAVAQAIEHGQADILSIMLAYEQRLASVLDFEQILNDARAAGFSDLAELASALIDHRELSLLGAASSVATSTPARL